jgi:hypothetical protein
VGNVHINGTENYILSLEKINAVLKIINNNNNNNYLFLRHPRRRLGVRILSGFRPCVPEHPADGRIIFGPKLLGQSGIRTTEMCLDEELMYLLYPGESNSSPIEL